MMSFPQYMDQWQAYVDQFEAKMLAEENIKVNVTLEMPSSDQYESVLQARLAGDDAPDLYTLHANIIGLYNKAGHLTDLSSEPLAAKIYENVKATVSVDGKLLAVPIESQAWGVLYNKTIFEDCGLTPPNTLTELKAVCKRSKPKATRPSCWHSRSSGCRS
jgi:raffinose/stachyose/melibiose transport system substrate-binding protein